MIRGVSGGWGQAVKTKPRGEVAALVRRRRKNEPIEAAGRLRGEKNEASGWARSPAGGEMEKRSHRNGETDFGAGRKNEAIRVGAVPGCGNGETKPSESWAGSAAGKRKNEAIGRSSGNGIKTKPSGNRFGERLLIPARCEISAVFLGRAVMKVCSILQLEYSRIGNHHLD